MACGASKRGQEPAVGRQPLVKTATSWEYRGSTSPNSAVPSSTLPQRPQARTFLKEVRSCIVAQLSRRACPNSSGVAIDRPHAGLFHHHVGMGTRETQQSAVTVWLRHGLDSDDSMCQNQALTREETDSRSRKGRRRLEPRVVLFSASHVVHLGIRTVQASI
jgi:hypothetical protein